MTRLLFALLYLTRLVQGTATNTTSSTCPELPEASYRSVWSILGSCALTLVICLWRTLHLNVPEPGDSEDQVSMSTWHVLSVIGGFFAPEYMVGLATEQWIEARQIVAHFREKGYELSMTHSHFSESGGFVHCDREGKVKVIKALEFLELCEAGKIVNPLVTEDEIRDRSKSDAVSKAIFTIQLLWFLLQVVVRRSIGLVVTLVELDTGCMALLAVFYLLFWWSKPLSVGCPHIFYENPEVKVYSREKLSEAWRPYRKSWWYTARKAQSTNDSDEEKRKVAIEDSGTTSKPKSVLNKAIQSADHNNMVFGGALLLAWCILGGLHLTAWNYEFPTEKEKIIWRAAALGLTVGPVVGVVGTIWDPIMYFGFASALVCRVMLVVLMFLSLRALPCSAHQIVSWVQYIPHL